MISSGESLSSTNSFYLICLPDIVLMTNGFLPYSNSMERGCWFIHMKGIFPFICWTNLIKKNILQGKDQVSDFYLL